MQVRCLRCYVWRVGSFSFASDAGPEKFGFPNSCVQELPNEPRSAGLPALQLMNAVDKTYSG
jgi:hypothetical protein